MLGTDVLTVTAAAIPKVTRNPNVMNVADLALGLLGNPSLKIPADKNMRPIKSVNNDTACIPSINVFAMPAREIPTPTIPIEVRPIPGVSRSQSLMSLCCWEQIQIINLYSYYTESD